MRAGPGPADRLRLGALGLTSRKGRAALSALGVAIGITAMVGVLGLSESSRADLNDQLDALGTNLLVVSPGQDMMGEDATLPDSSVGMIGRVPTVEAAAATYAVDAAVRKTDRVPDEQTSGIAVAAAGPGLADGGLRRAARGPLARRGDRDVPGGRARLDGRPPARGRLRSTRGSGSGSATSGSRWSGSSNPSSWLPSSTRRR